MISFIFNVFIPFIAFCRILAYFIFREQNLDRLMILAWKAFAVTLPIAAVSSLLIVQEPFKTFIQRMLITAAVMLAMQFSKVVIKRSPKMIRRAFYYLSACLTDFFAFITFLLIYRSASWHAIHKDIPKVSGVPILLIHGYRHDAGAWCYHQKRLIQEGFGSVFTIDLGYVDHSIAEYAERIQVKAENIAKETSSKELILVGYSMGGIVASYYALNLAKEETVKGVITLGSPLEGTKMAIFGDGECVLQFRYRTPFIKELKKKIASNIKIPFCHIGSLVDPLIRPPSSSWMSGGNTKTIIFNQCGHLEFLYSETITQTLADCLHEWQKPVE